METESGLTKDI